MHEQFSESVNVSASGIVKSGKGTVSGFFVSAASATPTIKLWKNTAASGTVIIDTFTPVAGTSYSFSGRDVIFNTGLYISIGGTVSCTVFYN